MARGSFVSGGGASIKPGSTMMWPGSTPPAGWLEENGAAISRTKYAALFAAIGTTYGAGDGATTFNLPETRGEFIRGWDNGRGADPGRTMGSGQGDAFRSHSHGTDSFRTAAGGTTFGAGPGTMGFGSGTHLSGGSETRPRNKAFMFIIKY